MPLDSPPGDPLLAARELDRLLADPLFSKSKLLQRLLRLLVDCALRNTPVTESFLAFELLGLEEQDFHPYTNPYVRVNTSLLRKRLRQYYARETPVDVIFHLPSGGFSLRIEAAYSMDAQWKRLFSQARLLSDSRYTEELSEAVTLLESVLQLKPDFAPAFARLASVHVSMAGHGAPPALHMDAARAAAARALELAPDSWEALCGAASVAGLGDHNWTLAAELFDRALAIPGNHVVPHPWFQAHMLATGRLSELLQLMERALPEYDLPPRNLQQNYGICLHIASRFPEAEAEMLRTSVLFPDDYSVWVWLAIQHWLCGAPARTLDALSRAVLASRHRMPGQLIASAMQTIRGKGRGTPPQIAGTAAEMSTLIASMVLGHHRAAFDALFRMLDARNPLSFILLRSPLVARLSILPDYPQLFTSAGLPPPCPDS
jgi:tetratricopeptide (TPR) repeat protein